MRPALRGAVLGCFVMHTPLRPIALIGLMGAGKTAVARALGERLAVSVADLDAMLEAETGRSVAAQFADDGEAEFRRREGVALRRALAAGVRVIACGGGVVLDPANRALLRERCDVVWLEVTPREAAHRLEPALGSRPLLADGDPETRLSTVLAERTSFYHDIAAGRGGRRVRGRRAMRRFVLLAGVALAAGCAPKATPPAEVTRDMVRERFESRRAGRLERAAGLEAQLLVWTRIGSDKLPGMEARVLLASPERARIRIASAFGTAADLVLRGDSAVAYIPSRREVVRVDAAGDSLGVRDPARWLVSALTATWDPPADAWSAADRRDSVVRVTWREPGMVRELDIGGSGGSARAARRGRRAARSRPATDAGRPAGGSSGTGRFRLPIRLGSASRRPPTRARSRSASCGPRSTTHSTHHHE